MADVTSAGSDQTEVQSDQSHCLSPVSHCLKSRDVVYFYITAHVTETKMGA